MWKKFLPLFLVPLMLAGCATTFTNLTPSRQPRNPDNLYPVEVAYDTREQALRWDSIQPAVLVGSESYPLKKVPFMKNRWEGLVPVPPGAETITYRFLFDYLVNDFGGPTSKSASSHKFDLRILEK